ncbi:MAG TPA: prepilin-type N-terminal cleavage/methylation domain-containing protein [Blastocatellia bacterium]|jgi:prepilin-type N-terminal cleavage/methylation domain-containing protein|nr:prepilin-type N-terminal cleavage/methylation domain-containing protein [Blastocatellia bacterium]
MKFNWTHDLKKASSSKESGFSLVEVTIALAIALVSLAIASKMLAGTFNLRARENQRSEALADVQRALNIMTREIANSGFGLTSNGIVAGDSDGGIDGNAAGEHQVRLIRFRANLNAFAGEAGSATTNDSGEDVKYLLYVDDANQQRYLVRYDVNADDTTVLANRIDTLSVRYFSGRVNYTSDTNDCNISLPAGVTEVANKANAKYLVVVACVRLPALGTPGGSGYQPATVAKLVSDIELRNQNSRAY